MHYSSRPGGVIPHHLPEVNFLMVEIPTSKPYIFMIRVTRQIKCLIAQAPGVIPHPLPEVNFLMVEIPTLKPYIYSLFSCLFIKQDQMIMTCNSAVPSLMLSQIFFSLLNSLNLVERLITSRYLFLCVWISLSVLFIFFSCCIVIKLQPSWRIFLCAILFIYNKWCFFLLFNKV